MKNAFAVLATVVTNVIAVAEKYNIKPTQVALSWILNKSAVVSPIIGATKLSHISDAVSSIDIELSSEDIKKLESAYQPRVAEPNI